MPTLLAFYMICGKIGGGHEGGIEGVDLGCGRGLRRVGVCVEMNY